MAKVRITFKDPDGFYESTQGVYQHDGNYDEIPYTVQQYFEYSEYLTVEIDDETGEAEVIKYG